MTPIFTHWALHVQDIKESVEFYREFCGLEIVREHGEGPNDHAVWMTEAGRKGNYVIVLLLGGLGNNQAKSDLTHFGFAVSSRDEVDQLAEKGKSSGCLAWESQEFPFPVGYRCAVYDPDGYIVEFSYGQPLGPGASSK